MGASPEDYVQFLVLAFKPTDDMDWQPAPKQVATNAYELLDSWRSYPGLNTDGWIEERIFVDWSHETRKRAALVDRLTIADLKLGESYAHAKADPDGLWPPQPIRDLLDGAVAVDLRRGFSTGVYNSRGVTSRAVYEGGGQERAIADRYEMIAQTMDNSHPRLAATLREIAEGYRLDAKAEDERATISERWHP